MTITDKEYGKLPGRWLYVGIQRGVKCRFEVRIIARHPELPDYWHVQAMFAHNCLYEPTGYCPCRDLEQMSQSEGV